MVFPIVKLGYLVLKQLSKPVANQIKRKAKAHPFFRNNVCMPPAQFYNRLEVNYRLKILKLGKAKNIEPLSEKAAIELGGEILGELLVFTFGAAILIIEYTRGANKEKAKEDKLKAELQRMNDKLVEVKTVSDIQKEQISDLQKQTDSLLIEKKFIEKVPQETNTKVGWFK